MDKLKRERKGWFYSYNMIFDQPISEHAKIIYLYLCRCADEDGQSFPSQAVICIKCGIKSRQTVSDAMKELEKIGLLRKINRLNQNGAKRSNLYIVQDTPCPTSEHTHVQPVDIPCPTSGHTMSNQWTYPCPTSGHKGLPNEGLPRGGEQPAPTPVYGEYGDNKKIRLTSDEYKRLILKYGKSKTNEYIRQLDTALYVERVKDKPNKHYAIIIEWILRDERNWTTPTKRNRFSNFEPRKRDWADLERQEREYLQKDLKKMRPADALTSEAGRKNKTITNI